MDNLNNAAFDDNGLKRTATLQGEEPEGLNMHDLSGIMKLDNMSAIKPYGDGETEGRPSDSLASLQDFMSNAKFGQKPQGGRLGGAPVIPGLNLGSGIGNPFGDEQSGSKVITPQGDHQVKFPTARVPERAR